MSEIKLFRLAAGKVAEVAGAASDLEKPLQTLIEQNLETLLGIRFLASEYSTGKTHAGRIDTLGIDENDCPVILEYKRSLGENVINQGLFYLDWLMDHQAEFKLLVMDRYGKVSADRIDWSEPRLVCVAADFTKYDAHAVQQMHRSIELIRYRRFGTDLLLFELVNATTAATAATQKSIARSGKATKSGKGAGSDKPVAEWLAEILPTQRELFESIEGFVLSLGDDVQRKELKLYVAYKRFRNFVSVVVQKDKFVLYLRLDPRKVQLTKGFTRDVRKIGHWATGDLEVSIGDAADFERAKPLIREAYEGGSSAG